MNPLKSPISGNPMAPVTLTEGLGAWQCTDSGGHYIPAVNYLHWLELQPARLPHLPESSSTLSPSSDSTEPLFCPESGTLMIPYKVGHGFPFSVHRSITGGIWLDGGEWEALKERNFHDEIHLVFTAPWQKHVRNENAQAVFEERMRSALGPELFQQLVSLRDTLENHPERSLAIAFLSRVLG